jgi:hypothetical protein
MKILAIILKLLVPLGLAALIIAGALLASCAAMPDYGTMAFVHQSTPMHGPGPAPIGDHERTQESTLDGVQAGVAWEGRRLFGDLGATYALSSRHMRGGPWHVTARVGMRFRFSEPVPEFVVVDPDYGWDAEMETRKRESLNELLERPRDE